MSSRLEAPAHLAYYLTLGEDNGHVSWVLKELAWSLKEKQYNCVR